MYDEEKMKHINPETLKLFQKYQIDMSIRDLSQNSIVQYKADLMQWFIFMYDQQFNLSVLEATEDDLTEYYFWRKQQGNNVNRQKRVMASISAFFLFASDVFLACNFARLSFVASIASFFGNK